jgi:hypothetical protein
MEKPGPEALVDDFEAGTLDNSEFPHERHVQVAWGLAQKYGGNEGLDRLIAGIRRIATRAGRPDAYHVTITRAWFQLIAPVEDLSEHEELLDKTLLRRYYSPDRPAAGRELWLEPDLHPLELPPPAAPSVDVSSVRPDVSVEVRPPCRTWAVPCTRTR